MLTEFAEALPESLTPKISGAEAVRLALQRLPPDSPELDDSSDSLEMLSWLELPWDDAPALVVCQMNEGYAPAPINSSLFLPND